MRDSLTMVLQHASTNLTTEGRRWRTKRISTLVKRNPVGISNNMFRTSSLAQWSPRSPNFPQNLPLGSVPTPSNSLLSAGINGPHNDKSSKFGSHAIMAQIPTRLTPRISMVKEVTDSGNLQSEGNRGPRQFPAPDRDKLRTFVNRGMCSKNSSGNQLVPLIEIHRARTWWAGLSSGTGNASSHLSIPQLKKTVWKRCRLHNGTHDFDASAHARRDLRSIAR